MTDPHVAIGTASAAVAANATLNLTILYGHPENPEAFETYYANTHLQIADKISGDLRREYTKFLGDPMGGQPAFYRKAEFWFESPEAMQTALGSPEGMAASADLGNFATGGVSFLVGMIG